MSADSAAPLAVLLLAYGGPETLEQVPDFLARVMGSARVTPEVLERACRRYRALGGGSPLVANTWAQADALQHALAARFAGDVRVFVGMRHSEPFLGPAAEEALAFGEGRAWGLIMASHRSRGATGGYEKDARQYSGLHLLPSWHGQPGYLAAVTDTVRAALAELGPGEPPLLLFSAHSLPLPAGQEADEDYESSLAETAAQVVRRLGDYSWRLAYQSRSSRPGVRWLGPGVEAVLEQEAAAGRRAAVVVPLGFVVEHLETLFDLDIELKEKADSLGMEMTRAATVRDHPDFIAALAEVVLERVATPTGVTAQPGVGE